MLRVCQGATTKADMMEQSLTEYKEMYTIARAQFRRITAYFNIVLLRSLEQTSNGQPKAANVLWSLRTVDLVWPSSHYSQILYLQVQYVISPAIIGCQRSPCSET